MTGIGVLGVLTNSAGKTDGVALCARGAPRGRPRRCARAGGPRRRLRGYHAAGADTRARSRDPSDRSGGTGGARRRGPLGRGVDRRGRQVPLIVGGDCPILLGCLAAFGSAETRGLLFVDGHEDAYPPELSTTGEAADMELGFALGLVDTPWWPGSVESAAPRVPAARVAPRSARPSRARSGRRHVAGRPSPTRRRPPTHRRSRGEHPGGGGISLPTLVVPPRPGCALDGCSARGRLSASRRARVGRSDVVAATALAAGPVGWDVTIYNPDLDPAGSTRSASCVSSRDKRAVSRSPDLRYKGEMDDRIDPGRGGSARRVLPRRDVGRRTPDPVGGEPAGAPATCAERAWMGRGLPSSSRRTGSRSRPRTWSAARTEARPRSSTGARSRSTSWAATSSPTSRCFGSQGGGFASAELGEAAGAARRATGRRDRQPDGVHGLGHRRRRERARTRAPGEGRPRGRERDPDRRRAEPGELGRRARRRPCAGRRDQHRGRRVRARSRRPDRRLDATHHARA